jgi:hypothetical protein
LPYLTLVPRLSPSNPLRISPRETPAKVGLCHAHDPSLQCFLLHVACFVHMLLLLYNTLKINCHWKLCFYLKSQYAKSLLLSVFHFSVLILFEVLLWKYQFSIFHIIWGMVLSAVKWLIIKYSCFSFSKLDTC